MAEAPYKIVATKQNFMTAVVEASRSTPVLVDFWAPWCGPCQTLMPMLDRIADDYAGRFVLAKVNTDEEQQLAVHFGIRSIPMVMLVHQGEVVDQFVGVQPESSIRALLDKYVAAAESPPPADAGPVGLVQRAEQELLTRDTVAAAATLEQLAAETPDHPMLPRLRAQLSFAEAAAQHPDVMGLREALERNPADSAARHAFAAHHALAGDFGTALAEWLELMRRDRKYGDDAARRSLLMVFALLGDQDELVQGYRRRMASLLH